DALDTLTYSAALTGGGSLPAWLTFTPATRTFSGNPSHADATPLDLRGTPHDGPGGPAPPPLPPTPVNAHPPPPPPPLRPRATPLRRPRPRRADVQGRPGGRGAPAGLADVPPGHPHLQRQPVARRRVAAEPPGDGRRRPRRHGRHDLPAQPGQRQRPA